MRERLLRLLATSGVTFVSVDRDSEIHGTPALSIYLKFTQHGEEDDAEFRFAKANQMSEGHIATVIRSHIGVVNGNES